MQIIKKTASSAVLLVVITVGICPQKALAQIYRTTTISGRRVTVPQTTSISVIDHSVEDQYLEYLQTLVDCDFQKATLANVADFIQQRTSVPIHFDERALEEAGVKKDSTVSFRASQIPARMALRLILNQMDLTIVAKSNVILITTVERANSELDSRVYPVADLVGVKRDGMELQDFDSLLDLITTIVAPSSWDEVGGPGSIQVFRPKSALVVSQTADAHEAVAGLIEVLRRLPSTYSTEVRTRIRRLPPARNFPLQLAERPDNGQTPASDVDRMAGAGPRNATHHDAAGPNVPIPSWRAPRSHHD